MLRGIWTKFSAGNPGSDPTSRPTSDRLLVKKVLSLAVIVAADIVMFEMVCGVVVGNWDVLKDYELAYALSVQ